MTKEQTTVIPEELYNLTQLAEVTLAAGRLSTTNANEIKDYIQSKSSLTQQMAVTTTAEAAAETIRGITEFYDELPVIERSVQPCAQQQINDNFSRLPCPEAEINTDTTKLTTTTFTTATNISSNKNYNTNNNNNNNYGNRNDDCYTDTDTDSIRQDSAVGEDAQLIKTKQQPILPMESQSKDFCSNSRLDLKHPLHLSPVAYASSDDDSNYYSHKIFDRKKSRRSTISDNSRYDEHSMSSSSSSSGCGSSPSCCGDEVQTQKAQLKVTNQSIHEGTSHALQPQQLGLESDQNQHFYGQIYFSNHLVNTEGMNGNNSDDMLMDSEAVAGSAAISVSAENGSLLEDEHICPECGKKYSTSSNLARHRQTHRSIMDKKARRCPYCEKVYVSMPAFSMHVRTHNQGCECPFCGKCFSRPWLLQGHIRTHTGEKPFKCSVCNKAFADKSNLRAHIQTHSNVKPHTCARCGKAFALKSYLYKHEESSCMKSQRHISERESRAGRGGQAVPMTDLKVSLSCQGFKSVSNYKINLDSAKSTLATKLLQKGREQRHNSNVAHRASNRNLAIMTIRSDLEGTALETTSKDGIPSTTLAPLVAMASGIGPDFPIIRPSPDRTFTTLSSLTVREEYEYFNRISVIQPTNTTGTTTTATAATQVAKLDIISSLECEQSQNECEKPEFKILNLPEPTAMNCIMTDSSTDQDEPVDFSPKSAFTHSAKSSPFELTNKYALVA